MVHVVIEQEYLRQLDLKLFWMYPMEIVMVSSFERAKCLPGLCGFHYYYITGAFNYVDISPCSVVFILLDQMLFSELV